jgi:hypothetical protein
MALWTQTAKVVAKDLTLKTLPRLTQVVTLDAQVEEVLEEVSN